MEDASPLFYCICLTDKNLKFPLDKLFCILYNIIKQEDETIPRKGVGIMTEWTKIDEQCVGLIGYEDFISADGKLCKRVWYDGEEEIFEIAE